MTCQFICDVVYDVCIVQPPSLVLPPTFDVDARLPLEIRQVEVVSEDTNKEYISSKRRKNNWLRFQRYVHDAVYSMIIIFLL